jgi:Zn-dependent peptidase ImmA (M78 family)
LPGVTLENESSELRNALRLALYRRTAALQLYDELKETPPSFHTAAHPDDDPEQVGDRIRKLLNVSWQQQLEWSSANAALNGWRVAVEALGVLVFQTGEVSVEEMRGTSIPRSPLLVILLNSSDAPHARIFTLLHEFAHILLANGGHETTVMASRPKPEDQLIERVSNRFASAALLPRKEFLSEASRFPTAAEGDDEALRRFANRIKASPETILRRLVSFHKAPASLYKTMRRKWQARSWYVSPPTGRGPPIEVRVIANAGRPFISLILDGYKRRAVSSSEVSDYLGLQLKYINRLVGQLAHGPSA